MVIEKFKLKIMKKLLTLVLVLFLFSCETEEKVKGLGFVDYGKSLKSTR